MAAENGQSKTSLNGARRRELTGHDPTSQNLVAHRRPIANETQKRLEGYRDMARAGEQILLMNASGHACYLQGEAIRPGDFIQVVLDRDFDLLAAPKTQARGPWGARGWTMDELHAIASEIRNRRSGRVLWQRAASAPSWQTYADYAAGREHTVRGNVQVLSALYSPQLQNERDILVYLPPSYSAGTQRYPVVYMHDGQNLFDQRTAYSYEWQVDETLEAGGRPEAIVVGIPNMGVHRCNEYSPFEDRRFGGGCGAAYLRFLVETLKPRIDAQFRTQPSREHTAIFGSSMGGLISLYGFFRHPDVFGLVGAMSPSLWFANRAIFSLLEYARRAPGRVYLDVGTGEGQTTLADTRRMYEQLRRKGYSEPETLHYVEAAGAGHSETAWGERGGAALEFMLARTAPVESTLVLPDAASIWPVPTREAAAPLL
jgi:predicted alpha/beta superfamily hydrolase